MTTRIGIVAGELSGDQLGSGLIRAVRQRRPDIEFEGVTGPAMRAAGCRSIFQHEELAVMGLVEVLKHLPRLLRRRRELVQHWTDSPPAAFIGIDAPDFNLGLSRRLRETGVTTIQYVCPSVWAWREGRVRTIRRSVDKVLCLLPFEPEFLRNHAIDGDFVGHPLASEIAVEPDRENARRALSLPSGRVVLLLPGSRRGELKRLGEPFIETAIWLARRDSGLSFIAALASDETEELFREQMNGFSDVPPIQIVRNATHAAMSAADVILVASGTAALEAALHQRPMAVAYRLNSLTYGFLKFFRILKITNYSLPNLLAGKAIVPEFVQTRATAELMGPCVKSLFDHPERSAEQRSEFAKLHAKLAYDANERAADALLATLDKS